MKTLIGFALILFLAVPASACPKVLGIVDPLCDEKIRFFITGDSIVRGIGDSKGIGYPGRLENKVGSENFEVLNIGSPGADATRLFRGFVRLFYRGRKTDRNTTDVDYGMIQVGTNAYWSGREPFQEAAKIRRLKKWLERNLKEKNGVKPVIFTATPPLTEREYQNPFILELIENLKKLKGLNLIVKFHPIPVERLASADTLHPSDKGYNIMAGKVRRSLFNRAQLKANKQYHDLDGDGVYDEAEVGRFLTSPLEFDSDGDGLSDGEELLTYKTNPNAIDTDSDSISDRDEILGGTDPLTVN